jgi:DNA-directed RNA polymerase specialized sigma24 family protein
MGGTLFRPPTGTCGADSRHNAHMEERGGTGSLSLGWEEARQLAAGERQYIRQRVRDRADRDEIEQELVIRLVSSPPRDENPWARKRYVRKVTITVIAEHYKRKDKQLGYGVLSPPDLLTELDGQCRVDGAPEPLAMSADMEDRLSKELHKRANSLRAIDAVCPVQNHRSRCPDAVLLSVAEAFSLAADRLSNEKETDDGHSALERPRLTLREAEVRRRIAERRCNQKAAEKWVERVILPCFDWWVYRTIGGLDGFDIARYARMHALGHESWNNPLPQEWSAAQSIIRSVGPHRWMVLRHIKIVNGRWYPEKYGIKRMRALLLAYPDLDGIIRIHMPDVAQALDLGGEG